MQAPGRSDDKVKPVKGLQGYAPRLARKYQTSVNGSGKQSNLIYMATITTVKSFKVQAPVAFTIKYFYDRK